MVKAKLARLETRLTNENQAVIKRAAEIQGRTLTDFVVASALNAAEEVIVKAEVISLSRRDQECFAQAMLSVPKPSPALQRAFTRRSELLRDK